jgi:tRNA-dihydrouridine synthase
MFTEFVNVDGLLHPQGFERLKIALEYTEAQRPIVAQIWGRDPQKFEKAARLISQLGFDGIDINMGCPQDKEIAQNLRGAHQRTRISRGYYQRGHKGGRRPSGIR